MEFILPLSERKKAGAEGGVGCAHRISAADVSSGLQMYSLPCSLLPLEEVSGQGLCLLLMWFLARCLLFVGDWPLALYRTLKFSLR